MFYMEMKFSLKYLAAGIYDSNIMGGKEAKYNFRWACTMMPFEVVFLLKSNH